MAQNSNGVALNQFNKGLHPDFHPLTHQDGMLTDALNATFVTNNGNELIIQNDMGNTTILDTRSGHVMELSQGFVPLGMKEYGGILYIASYNPETKAGELGTIPSPLITYTPQEALKVNYIKDDLPYGKQLSGLVIE